MFNFHSAFLNGQLGPDEEIFMEQPLGYEEADRLQIIQIYLRIETRWEEMV
jgi:hypothetical protein